VAPTEVQTGEREPAPPNLLAHHAPVPGPSRRRTYGSFKPEHQLTVRKLRSSFWQEHKADWQYSSTTIPVTDIRDRDDKVQMRNHFWHDVKTRAGSFLRVILTEEAGEPFHKMIFQVLGFQKKKGRTILGFGLPMASTTAFCQRGGRTNFEFKIIDPALASDHRVSIQFMKEAAENVFETTILRCVDPSGRKQLSSEDIENLYNEIEEEESTETKVGHRCVEP